MHPNVVMQRAALIACGLHILIAGVSLVSLWFQARHTITINATRKPTITRFAHGSPATSNPSSSGSSTAAPTQKTSAQSVRKLQAKKPAVSKHKAQKPKVHKQAKKLAVAAQKNKSQKQKKLAPQAAKKPEPPVFASGFVGLTPSKPKKEEMVEEEVSQEPAIIDLSESGTDTDQSLIAYAISSAIRTVWRPPVGSNNTHCTITITLDKKGAITHHRFDHRSGSVSFDLLAQKAVVSTRYPQTVWNSTLTINF